MSIAQVLKGIRVVEQGTFITGPCAGMMLADLGADVIKIESPEGDPYRNYQGDIYSPHFQAYNRNKRAMAFDLKNAADREVFEKLIAKADVYIQNFRPGAAGRIGAGPERLHKINPALVYTSISGFGSSGPYMDRPSYDSVAQALSGFLGVVVDPDRPRFLGPALADAITGIYAAYGILGALLERTRTHSGRHVEVSMLEAMAHFAVEPFAAFFALGINPKSSDRPRLAQGPGPLDHRGTGPQPVAAGGDRAATGCQFAVGAGRDRGNHQPQDQDRQEGPQPGPDPTESQHSCGAGCGARRVGQGSRSPAGF